MMKLDPVALRAEVLAEYSNYPNPTNDPVTEFERRAAPVIADFAVMMVKEHNELGTPDPVLIEGVASVAAIMMVQVISFAPEAIRERIVAHAMQALFTNLTEAQKIGEINIPHRDVGDA